MSTNNCELPPYIIFDNKADDSFIFSFGRRGIEIRALEQKIQVQTVKPTDSIRFIASSK